MQPISAVIITKNEERNIGRTLAALEQVADEIIVVDCFSTDATEQICKDHHVRFYQQEWLGYGPQKNFGIARASHDTIINLDADEVLSPAAIEELLRIKKEGFKGVYALKLVQSYFGKFLRHGMEAPVYRNRIFNRNEILWNMNPVHEKLDMPDTAHVIKVKGDVLHYSYYSVEHYLAKSNNYTTLAAKALFDKGKRKYRFKLLVSPAFTFVKSYIIKAGFLDGMYGLIIARFNAHTNFLKYVKLRELCLKEKAGQKL